MTTLDVSGKKNKNARAMTQFIKSAEKDFMPGIDLD